VDGLLVIDKPEGPTSHDVVARIRRVLGERRIGHTGTLDPLATGVLPLLVGRATRLAQFLSGDDKRYLAGIRLGVSTTTYDREGEPVGAAIDPAGVTRDQIEAALERFRGTFLQTPPIYSAKKVAGVSAHRLARRGEAAALTAVSVTVHTLTLVAPDTADRLTADLELDVRCSAGFYVRALAHDLGVALGCGAHLRTLRRTAAGAIGLEAALPLARAEADPEAARTHLLPMSALLPDWPAVRVTMRGAARVRNGGLLGRDDCEAWVAAGPAAGETASGAVSVRVLDGSGELVALAAWSGPAWIGPATSPETSPETSNSAGSPLLHPRVVLV
jgi:tRNA pseudouridine55 synthase